MNVDHDQPPSATKAQALQTLTAGPLSSSVAKLAASSRCIPSDKDFHFYRNFEEFKVPVEEIARAATGSEVAAVAPPGVTVATKDKKTMGPKSKVPFHIPTIRRPQDEYNIVVNNANMPFEHVWLQRSDDGLSFIHPLVSFLVHFASVCLHSLVLYSFVFFFF